MLKQTSKQILTILIGLLGAYIFIFLNLPLPWLLGSVVATFVASRIEVIPLSKSKILINLGRIIIGITLGSAFSPKLLSYLSEYIYSLLAIIPFVIISAFLGMWYYHKILKYDKITSYFSAMPGGLVEMIIIGRDLGADTVTVTLAQSIRAVFVVCSLPFFIEFLSGNSLSGLANITEPLSSVSIFDLGIMVLIGIVGVFMGVKLKFFGAYMIGPMVVAIVFYLSDFIEVKPPNEFLEATQVVLGVSIGIVFRGIDTKILLKTIINSCGFLFIITAISLVTAFIVHYCFGFSLISTVLAFAPGGQSNINLIAIILGANIPYIALHHLFRIILIVSLSGYFVPNTKRKE